MYCSSDDEVRSPWLGSVKRAAETHVAYLSILVFMPF